VVLFSNMENSQSSASGAVAANVRRLRSEQGWSLADLSEALEAVGHPMSIKVLSKMETGERGIGVDDLAAFMTVFHTPPRLLMLDPALAADQAVGAALERYLDALEHWNQIRHLAKEGLDRELEALRETLARFGADGQDVLRTHLDAAWADDADATASGLPRKFFNAITAKEAQ